MPRSSAADSGKRAATPRDRVSAGTVGKGAARRGERATSAQPGERATSAQAGKRATGAQPGDTQFTGTPLESGAPRLGLRARKKAATMRHVQSVALEMFKEHGFDAVSIEQVADAALVSPSTLYRYFGTKEGLVLHDEYDDRIRDSLSSCLADGLSLAESVNRALEEVWGGHFVQDMDVTVLRTRLCLEVPSIQGAMARIVNEEVDAIARAAAESGRWDFPTARVLTSGVIWAIIAVLRNWYDGGFTTNLREDIDRFVTMLSAMEATSDLGGGSLGAVDLGTSS
ncbi:TetR family transcriptional regulator [Actinobaculum sp. 352]|uniref:TetR/AcrR family transcriptional regulator n=1 Tax=Actinobaculum sp. 352 TaxID=2490946 RepID=UPI001F493612|nr:TetR family transcriptional regulator [Actinobaculum sp. 352]